jgi:hypothetical protein
MKIDKLLQEFAQINKMKNKGALCVALIVTRHAKNQGLPLNPDKLLTSAGGQVIGLGKSAVQSILKEHGIERVLAEEGGRTSRGSVGNMRKYVSFLNDLSLKAKIDIDAIENWWIDRVKEFFSGKPFIFCFDSSKSLRVVIRELLSQAEKRQSRSTGATLVGAMLQYLVGAKLNLILKKPIEYHGASVADESSGMEGDFLVEDVVIHVTTSPTESLIRKCQKNLDQSLRPIIITTQKGLAISEGLAEQAKIEDRLDVFEAEQFLAGNLYEIGKFSQSGRKITAEQLIAEYNMIIEECETDPSLRVEVAK